MKRVFRTFCVLTALSALAMGCANKLSFPVEPEIRFVSVTPDTVREYDAIDLTIHYQDGDGDLGAIDAADTSEASLNFFAVDSRITEPVNGYDGVIKATLPNLTPESRHPSIQGDITIRLESMLRLDPESLAEEVRFTVYIRDRAGHVSNKVETTPIVVLP